MAQLLKTPYFARWLDNLRDDRARSRIQIRIQRLADGNVGDVRPIGSGVSELRIDYGPGYRVYFTIGVRGVIVLLAGGQKRNQQRDIQIALHFARNLEG